MSEALRPSWKLAAGRLPWAWGRRWEERFKGVPVGSRALFSAPEARSVDISPIAACKEGAGLDEDFRQLSDEAPSEGLTTIPKTRRTGINSESVRRTESGSTRALVCRPYMAGCTGGSGPTPQPECVSARWWSAGAGARELAWPPPPPGPWVAPPR